MPSHVAVMRLAGGQGPEFGISVNPIPTRGADYAHRIISWIPGFENLTAYLQYLQSIVKSKYAVQFDLYAD